MKKFTCSVLFVLFTFFSITAYSDENEVRIGYLPVIASLSAYVAQENKLFEKEGIKATYKLFQSSNDIVNAMVAGEIDITPEISIIPILHLEEKYPNTVRITSHSRITEKNPLDNLLVLKSSGINKLSDLQGKKIGVFPGTSATNLLKAFLKNKNIDLRNIVFIPLAPTVQIQSLESKAIDALLTYEPITTIALLQNNSKVLHSSVYTELLSPSPLAVTIISQEFKEKNPQLAQKSINILDKSIEYIATNQAASRLILSKYIKIPIDISNKVVLSTMMKSTNIDIDNLQKCVGMLVKITELESELDIKNLEYSSQVNKNE